MTRRQARRLGAADGIEVVEDFLQMQGEADFLDLAIVDGWDDVAINAGVAQIRRVPDHLRNAYYVAYERAAHRTACRIRQEVRAKVARREALDTGIYGDPREVA